MRPDGEVFVRTLRPALRAASSIARALEGRVQNRPKLGEATDVKAAMTLADAAAQEAILVPLHEHYPDVGLAAEEETATAQRFPACEDPIVVVDPIDGTLRSYLDGLGPYAVMVGLGVKGRYEAALVALPREDLFFEAARGRGAWMASGSGEPGPIRFDEEARRVMLSYGAPEPALEYLRVRGYEPVLGCGGAIAVAPCLPGFCAGLRFANRPEGISIRGRIGLLVSEEAGAVSASDGSRPVPPSMAAHANALLVARDDSTLQELVGVLDGRV
jgi:fructose-1,6-bisphosphatase/inositol monophosphatase family enzyme